MTLTSTSRQITKEPDQFHIAGIRFNFAWEFVFLVASFRGKIGALREYQRLPPSLYQGESQS